MDNSPSVCCIILSYNGKLLTIDCIRSVLESYYPSFTILIVDNASSDGSVGTIKEIFSAEMKTGKVILIENRENLGFAGGNNVGILYALEKQYDYVLLLNNDTIIDPEMIRHMISGMNDFPDAGICGPKIYYFTPSDQIWFSGGEVSLWKGKSRHIGIRERDIGQYDKPAKCDYITGCGMLIKKEVLDKVGLLDTVYTLYSEDADFCMRARKAGYDSVFIPKAKMWHKISSATGGQLKWKKIKLKMKSNFIFYKRYARFYHWLTIPVFQIFEIFRILWLVCIGKIKNN